MCKPRPVHEGSKKAIIAAFFANLGIAIAKFVGFLLTGSAALVAESLHSLADTGNQGLLMLGNKQSLREADDDNPFGHARERYFWAFVVALVLFSLGGLFALYEGIQKMRHPHEVESLSIAIGILVFALALETVSLTTAVREARHAKEPGQGWWAYIQQAKQPELPVVLLEDIAAEAGLTIALAAVVAGHFTHEPRWDAAGSIAIGILLVVVAAVLAVRMKSLLLGEVASTADRDKLLRALRTAPHVKRVIYMHTEHLGPETLLVATKVEFGHQLSAVEVSDVIDDAEVRMRTSVPTAKYIFIEPDISRDQPQQIR